MALPSLPNALTIARGVAAPVYVLLVLDGRFGALAAAFVVFVLGALSDLWDGILARRRGTVTDFGRIADPIADKALTLGAFGTLAWVRPDLVPPWMALVIAVREVGITGWRLSLLGSGRVVAADVWGKWKTTFQMIAIIYTTFLLVLLGWLGGGDALLGEARLRRFAGGAWALALPYVATLTATLLAVVSGVETIIANRRAPSAPPP